MKFQWLEKNYFMTLTKDYKKYIKIKKFQEIKI